MVAHDRSRTDPGGSSVRVGLHALGIGNGSRPEILTAVARRAEAQGFATLWCGEHVVMVDEPRSTYPYSDDGKIAVPPDADWLDPLLTLGFIAGATRRIRLATGVLLLPEHNPLIVAKQAATLDVLSAGRFTVGVGIGWSAEEFAALGIPFARRAERTMEYIAAMRQVWADDVACFNGEFVSFDQVRVNPKPLRGRIPVVIGGTSRAALRRVAAGGDGWYGFNLAAAAVGSKLHELADLCHQRGRSITDLSIAVSIGDGVADLGELHAAGVKELVLVGEPPADHPQAAIDWVDDLAARWIGNKERSSAVLAQQVDPSSGTLPIAPGLSCLHLRQK